MQMLCKLKVVRSKQIDLKPMDLEEAPFFKWIYWGMIFIYVDVEDQITNVLYRREDGGRFVRERIIIPLWSTPV